MKTAGMLKVALPFVWLGGVVAISFMEAPLKFNAPNLTTPVALEVGHIVFDALNKAEWVLSLFLGASLLISRASKLEIYVFAAILIIILCQTFWLYPILDQRTVAIINSRPVPESNHHLVFIVLELLKAVLLPVLGVISLQRLISTSGGKVKIHSY